MPFDLTLLLAGKPAKGPLPHVEAVDLNRYLGKWYEIARLPAWFEKNGTGVTAEYSLRKDGLVRVVNTMRVGSLQAKPFAQEGRAYVLPKSNNAHLRVSFFGPFFGDYVIIDLDPQYGWVLVGSPSRKFMWILARTPQLDEAKKQELVQKAQGLGFDTAKLIYTVQPTA